MPQGPFFLIIIIIIINSIYLFFHHNTVACSCTSTPAGRSGTLSITTCAWAIRTITCIIFVPSMHTTTEQNIRTNSEPTLKRYHRNIFNLDQRKGAERLKVMFI